MNDSTKSLMEATSGGLLLDGVEMKSLKMGSYSAVSANGVSASEMKGNSAVEGVSHTDRATPAAVEIAMSGTGSVEMEDTAFRSCTSGASAKTSALSIRLDSTPAAFEINRVTFGSCTIGEEKEGDAPKQTPIYLVCVDASEVVGTLTDTCRRNQDNC